MQKMPNSKISFTTFALLTLFLMDKGNANRQNALKQQLTKQSLTGQQDSGYGHSLLHTLVEATPDPEVSSRNVKEGPNGPTPHAVPILHVPIEH